MQYRIDKIQLFDELAKSLNAQRIEKSTIIVIYPLPFLSDCGIKSYTITTR